MKTAREFISEKSERLPKSWQPLVVIRNGRDDWIRTSDLTHPKRARYQAAPRPVSLNLVSCERTNVKLCKHKRHKNCALALLRAALGFLLEERQQFAEF